MDIDNNNEVERRREEQIRQDRLLAEEEQKRGEREELEEGQRRGEEGRQIEEARRGEEDARRAEKERRGEEERRRREEEDNREAQRLQAEEDQKMKDNDIARWMQEKEENEARNAAHLANAHSGCSICHKTGNSVLFGFTTCSHVFHYSCIDYRVATCPICYPPMTRSTYYI